MEDLTKVTVSADAVGNVIVQSISNPEFGYIRVSQDRTIFDDNGFMSKKPVSALIHGTVSDLQSLNWKKGQELTGKVVIKQSLVAFNKKKPEIDYKVAGKTGIICTIGGSPIYYKTNYSSNANVEDSLPIKHDNTEAIIAKLAELKVLEAITSNSSTADFTL